MLSEGGALMGDRHELELGRRAYEIAAGKSWPVSRIIDEVRVALESAPESAALVEARERARRVASFRAHAEAESRLAHRNVAQLYIPAWPWAELAESPDLLAVYRRYLRPSPWGPPAARRSCGPGSCAMCWSTRWIRERHDDWSGPCALWRCYCLPGWRTRSARALR